MHDATVIGVNVNHRCSLTLAILSVLFVFIILPSPINCSNIKRHYSNENVPERDYVDVNKPKPPVSDVNITRYPVIILPGDGGNQIFAKLNKSSAPHYLCKLKTSDFELLWLNLEEIPPYVLDCFVDNIKLLYDNETRTTRNQAGVEIKIPGFGLTETVEYLDSSEFSATGYFNVIVQALVKKYNYVRGVNVRGAPYDWRRSPNEFHDYYVSFKTLVEETYEMNNQTQVIFIAHSMGKLVSNKILKIKL